MDIAPTVAHMMGVPIPQETDGQVLLSLFEESAEPSRRPVVEESLGAKGQTEKGVAYTEEETEQVESQLRGMGYLS
jgi:arylsulfatase A-like enzyme